MTVQYEGAVCFIQHISITCIWKINTKLTPSAFPAHDRFNLFMCIFKNKLFCKNVVCLHISISFPLLLDLYITLHWRLWNMDIYKRHKRRLLFEGYNTNAQVWLLSESIMFCQTFTKQLSERFVPEENNADSRRRNYTKITSLHRNEEDNWITITSNLQSAFQ